MSNLREKCKNQILQSESILNSSYLHYLPPKIDKYTISNPRHKRGDCFEFDFFSTKYYHARIMNDDYIYVMLDGSIIDFIYNFKEHGELFTHSLLYYPCPYFIKESERNSGKHIKDILMPFMEFSNNQNNIILNTPVRFDFDISSASEDHPSSHLTIQTNKCRIPIQYPLLPNVFFFFIMKYFLKAPQNLYSKFNYSDGFNSCLHSNHYNEPHLGW